MSMKQQIVKAAFGFALVFALAMPAAAQEVKIGVVNLQDVVQRAPQTAAIMNALREEFAPREREIVAKQKEIEELQAKVQKDLAVMGETERRNAEKNLRELGREFERLRTEYQEDSNLRQNEEIGVLQRSMLKEVQDFAESQGFDLIVGDGVLYMNQSVNITDEVLAAVQAKFQASAAQ